jgi:5,10-methylenetetrahydromethanopterin reductase
VRGVQIVLQARASIGADNPIDDLLRSARRADACGLDLSTPQLFDIDALTALAVIGREVPGLAVGTAVVPIYARHPIVMAMQALTVQAATRGRFTLGIGLCHKPLVEETFGLPFSAPVRFMREYLEVLMALLHEGRADFEGVDVTARTDSPAKLAGIGAPPVLVAALGTQMLKVTGRLADGTTLWMVGPKTVRDHIVPTLTRAAEAAGRPRPQVVVGLPVSVTSDPAAARDAAADEFSFYPTMPSYRAVLDMEGAAGPGDVAVVGDEEAVTARLEELVDAGATGFRVSVFGADDERQRTFALLGELAKRRPSQGPRVSSDDDVPVVS